jgi:mono/diheme cytochrome c family protein
MGCEQCHTPFKGPAPDHSKRYAGGLEVPEVFGTWRSPNISQDKDTGIGGWTDEQIIDAIRLGKRPDGEQLYPIMPYLFYNAMSDSDAKAIVAYLRTVPAVNHTVERVELKLPKIPAPPAKGTEPDTADAVAHGGYLANMMHCAACHTPMSPEGPDMSRAFAGGMELELPPLGEGKLYTANLTSDKKTGIGAWSDEEIVAAIRQMKKRDGSMIMPPMALYQGGWAMMTDADVNHLVAFLRSLPAIANAVPASTFKPHAAPPAAPPGDAPADAPAPK